MNGPTPRWWKVLLLTMFPLLALWICVNLYVGWALLPQMLLNAPVPARSESDREAIRARLASPASRWEFMRLLGGENRTLDVWRLHRPGSKGVIIYLHGFGDDVWGTIGRAADLPGWDAAGFTFRGRDRHPDVPCTLGGWERFDVVALVQRLERDGVPRGRMILAAWSQGAGVSLLALSELERTGAPLGGALLECPFEDIGEAAKNHVRLALGPWEPLIRPAEWLALARAGRQAGFEPGSVSPRQASQGLRTPIALITGDADLETPVAGVRAIAAAHPDLTVVPGAGHCQASGRLPGGWKGWAGDRLARWGH